MIAYALALSRPDAPHHLTHNPLGGWSVVAMLAAVLLQAATGLFASDDIMTQGPLNRHVSSGVGRLLTDLHEFNADVILALVAVHVAAVLFHLVYKHDNLIGPMITGEKPWEGPRAGDPQKPPVAGRGRRRARGRDRLVAGALRDEKPPLSGIPDKGGIDSARHQTLKTKARAVSQGAQPFGRRSILKSM